MARTPTQLMQDELKWQLIGTGGGCTALAIEVGGLRLLATWEGVQTPRVGETVWLCLTVGGHEQVCGGQVPWAAFIGRTAQEWLAAASERAIVGAREGESWPEL